MQQSTAIPLHARVEGSGEDVLLAHGLFGSAENLGGISRQLREQFRVHLLDMRNHGRSPHAAYHRYADLAADLLRYADDQALGRVHLVGHSMGGKAAMHCCLREPTRISTLSVIDIAPKPYPRHHDTILSALLALQANPPHDRRSADERIKTAVPESAVRQFLLKNLQRSQQGHFSIRLNLDAIASEYQEIAAWDLSLPASPTPTLFITGGNSNYIVESDRSAIFAQFPNARVQVIADGSHWVHAEKPDLVADAITRFIAEQTTR